MSGDNPAMVRLFELLRDEVRHLVAEVPPAELDRIRAEGIAQPLSEAHVRRILAKAIDAMITVARNRRDTKTLSYLESEKETIVNRVVSRRGQRAPASARPPSGTPDITVRLQSHNGVPPG